MMITKEEIRTIVDDVTAEVMRRAKARESNLSESREVALSESYDKLVDAGRALGLSESEARVFAGAPPLKTNPTLKEAEQDLENSLAAWR
jgi:hypothetical protein